MRSSVSTSSFSPPSGRLGGLDAGGVGGASILMVCGEGGIER